VWCVESPGRRGPFPKDDVTGVVVGLAPTVVSDFGARKKHVFHFQECVAATLGPNDWAKTAPKFSRSRSQPKRGYRCFAGGQVASRISRQKFSEERVAPPATGTFCVGPGDPTSGGGPRVFKFEKHVRRRVYAFAESGLDKSGNKVLFATQGEGRRCKGTVDGCCSAAFRLEGWRKGGRNVRMGTWGQASRTNGIRRKMYQRLSKKRGARQAVPPPAGR